MKKNYVLAVVLMLLVVMGGAFLQKRIAQKEALQNPPMTEAPAAENFATGVLPDDTANNFVVTELEETDLEERNYIVETDIVRAVFTNRGGDLISYRLKQHSNAGSDENVEMIANVTDTNRALSVSLGDYSAPVLNNLFSTEEETNANGEKIISFSSIISVKNSRDELEKFKLSKHYRFLPGEYLFELVITVEGVENFYGLNFNGTSYSLCSAPQIGPEWNKNDRYDFRRFNFFVDENLKKKQLKPGEVKPAKFIGDWVAVSGKYFTFAIIPENAIGNVTISADNSGKEFKTENSQFFLENQPMQSSKLQASYKIYIGPTGEKYLNPYSSQTKNAFGVGNLGLDNLASSGGFLAPLIYVLKILLRFTQSIVKNWGVAIIIVTVFIRLLMLPLSVKTMVGTQKLQPYQAELSEIQQKYKSNPVKLTEEMNKIYDKVGYKPGCVSGCLPLVLQFAVVISMFQLFTNYFEFRGATFIPGWIMDLSVGDSVYSLENPLPILRWKNIRLLPIIYVTTQYLSAFFNKKNLQNQQTQSMMFMMMYVMPAVFFFMLYDAPSGLFIYWITANILMIFQQIVTDKILEKELAKDKTQKI